MIKKRIYSLEEVARFAGLTKQTLCNWSGCNSGYKLKKNRDKRKTAAAVFILYHFYGRKRINVIKNVLKTLEEKCAGDTDIEENINLLKEEIKIIEEIYKNITAGKKFKTVTNFLY